MNEVVKVLIVAALALVLGFGGGLWFGLRGQGEGSTELAASEERVANLRNSVTQQQELISRLREVITEEWKNYSKLERNYSELEEYNSELEEQHREQTALYQRLRDGVETELAGVSRVGDLIEESIQLLQETTDKP